MAPTSGVTGKPLSARKELYTKNMGRGQTRIADHFTAIFGNRRGAGDRWAQVFPSLKDAFRPPFAAGTIDFNRRVALTQWLVEDLGTGIFTVSDIQETYRSIYAQTHSTLAAFQMEGTDLRDACIMDLDSLVFQGLCIKDGPLDAQYRLKDLFLWPKAHWTTFTAAIKGVGTPLSINPMTAGRRLVLLHCWPLGGPLKEKKAIQIYQEAYPGISKREVERDLLDLARQGICTMEVGEDGAERISYTLLPVEEWSAKHQQAYDVTRYPW